MHLETYRTNKSSILPLGSFIRENSNKKTWENVILFSWVCAVCVKETERKCIICYCTALLPRIYGIWFLQLLGFSGWCLGGCYLLVSRQGCFDGIAIGGFEKPFLIVWCGVSREREMKETLMMWEVNFRWKCILWGIYSSGY